MSRVLAILMTDIQNFTERTSRGSRQDLRSLLKAQDALLRPCVARFAGRIVKTIGDAFQIVFASPANAVQCGMLMQDTLRRHNEGKADTDCIRIRVAVTSGEVEEREGDVFGEAVNMAARLEAMTEVGEVYFTESVYLSMNKAEVPSSEVGLFRLKGLPEEIKVYRVIQDPHSENYRKLLDSMREGERFADVDIPVSTALPPRRESIIAGMSGLLFVVPLLLLAAICAWLLRPGPADELRRVEQDLRDGRSEEAMARALEMEKQMPALPETLQALRRVLEHEALRLAEEDRYGEALDFLRIQGGQHRWMQVRPLEHKVYLTMLDRELPRCDYAGMRAMLDEFDRLFPDDRERDRLVVRHTGPRWPENPPLYAIHAARRLAIAEDTNAAEFVGPLLLAGLSSYSPDSDTGAELRRLIARGDPQQMSAAVALLESNKPNLRNHALRLLEENGRLNDVTRLKVHLRNLQELTYSQARDLEYSLDWLERSSARTDFAELKARAGVEPFTDIAAMHEWAPTTPRVRALLQEPFRPEAPEFLRRSFADPQDLRLRVNARQCLEAAGLLDGLDLFAHHAANLRALDPAYVPEFVDEALTWFTSPAGRERRDEVLPLLAGVRESVREALKRFEGQRADQFRERALKNLQKIEATLEALR